MVNPTAGSSVVNQSSIQHNDGNWAIYLDSCTKNQRGLVEHCPELRHGVDYLPGQYLHIPESRQGADSQFMYYHGDVLGVEC